MRRSRRTPTSSRHHLRSLGVGPEVIVGLCVERSPEMVIGLLGILKAGGAYLPLDPGYPAERLAFMLAGRRRRRAADAVGADRAAVRGRSRRSHHPHRADRCRLARRRTAAHHRAKARTAPAAPRLRHLHLRLNRNPQRRRRQPRRVLPIKIQALAQDFNVGPSFRDRAFHFVFVRCFDRAGVAAIHRWRAAVVISDDAREIAVRYSGIK